ncbi:nuclear-interacting partner of ALK [Electrophorus electricus]|uniref:nuclear-interacting partner of ALK n=1 Tax=Electrophorus electricus TaxID=8005 RepID=UPI0015D03276|nr:nuclear-interacting partner of ALK [Electrophorus electricus]
MAMAGSRIEHKDKPAKSLLISPLKIRQLLSEGFAPEDNEDNVSNRSSQISNSLGPEFISEAHCEATNKDAFFARVESYSCLKWTGKPFVLSPLRCAQYGWINVDCDMLKCSSCQTFLCASLQPTLDFQKYEERILELTRQLQTQHKKFCSWPDFPCPERFWMVPVSEPEELFNDFLERFRSACLLQQQLPTMKSEQLKAMTLTEDVISSLLQLVEVEQKIRDESSSDPLCIQMAACTVALCGWGASPSLCAMNLPILTCTYCMRKVGLWNFYQLDGVGDGDNFSFYQSTTPVQEGRSGDRLTPTSPSQSPTPCRMKLRSQDTTRTEQSESSSSPLVVRTRSRDSPSPSEEMRGKRPVTRSRGHGDGLMAEMPSSPQRKTKRPRLSSASSPEGLLHRNLFDPVAQHRNWCPWVNVVGDNWSLDTTLSVECETELPQSGWRMALQLLLTMKRSISPVASNTAQGPEDKSKRVSSIFQHLSTRSSEEEKKDSKICC